MKNIGSESRAPTNILEHELTELTLKSIIPTYLDSETEVAVSHTVQN